MTPDDGPATEPPPAPRTRSREALGPLVASIGHHLINALSAIVSNAELIRMQGDASEDSEARALADAIINTALDSSVIMRRMLDFGRISTAVPFERLDLVELIQEAVGAACPPPGISAQWELELGPLPAILGHRGQVLEVLGEALANAVESLPEGGGPIRISTGRDNRGWVAVEIRDSGCGMGPEVQERAIEPFFTTKPGHQGIGLSLLTTLWRRHRGTFSLQSEPGVGTVLRLFIEPVSET